MMRSTMDIFGLRFIVKICSNRGRMSFQSANRFLCRLILGYFSPVNKNHYRKQRAKFSLLYICVKFPWTEGQGGKWQKLIIYWLRLHMSHVWSGWLCMSVNKMECVSGISGPSISFHGKSWTTNLLWMLFLTKSSSNAQGLTRRELWVWRQEWITEIWFWNLVALWMAWTF